MQDELRPRFAKLTQLLVQANAVPVLQNFRLALGQASLHRERRVGQVQGRFIISHVGRGSLFKRLVSQGLVPVGAGGSDIRRNRCLQRVQRGKPLFITQFMFKGHA